MIVEMFVIIIFAVAFLLQYLNKKKPEVGNKPQERAPVEAESKRNDRLLKDSLISEEDTN